MVDPAFRRWFRLMLIHYPDGKPPTRWSRDSWRKDDTSEADVQAQDVQDLLVRWLGAHNLRMTEAELTALAGDVIAKAEAKSAAGGEEEAPRLQCIHDELTETLRKLGGFDLRLMSSLNDVSGIPTEGKNLIIVAAVNNVLRFRICAGDGKVVVDTDEKSLTEQARQIEDLREQLKSLWPPHELTWSDKDRIITAVTSIVGHTPGGAS